MRSVRMNPGATALTLTLDGPSSTAAARVSPTSEALRRAFMAEEYRSQRRSDGTISLEGCRFEIPSRYRHMERIAVRWAEWDLTLVYLVDDRTGSVLCRLFPLDRTQNADGQRRSLEPIGASVAARAEPGIAPLLEKLMNDYRNTGLPPAYVPMPVRRPEPEAAPSEEDPA